MANLVFDFLHNYKTGERRESDPADAYQYDEGHVFEAVVPAAVTSCEIHYWARGFDEAEAYTPASITQNTDNSYTITGNIPNKFFETYGDLRVYIVVTDDDASITTYEGRIHICERSRPDDYVDDDPDNEATRVLVEARAAAATATEAAQTAQDVADSIPADYSQMSEDVTQLKEDLSDVENDVRTNSDVVLYKDFGKNLIPTNPAYVQWIDSNLYNFEATYGTKNVFTCEIVNDSSGGRTVGFNAINSSGFEPVDLTGKVVRVTHDTTLAHNNVLYLLWGVSDDGTKYKSWQINLNSIESGQYIFDASTFANRTGYSKLFISGFYFVSASVRTAGEKYQFTVEIADATEVANGWTLTDRIEHHFSEVESLIQDVVYDFTNIHIKGINHRGYNRIAPENTLPAFRLSKQKGFEFVETDVQKTSDGVYVLLHDASINRTARNADGTTLSETVNISSITYAQALTYDFGIWKGSQYAGTKILTFEEFIVLCSKLGLYSYIELKQDAHFVQDDINNLVAIVKKYHMEKRVSWISFSWQQQRYVFLADNSARIGWLGTGMGTTVPETALASLSNGKNEVFMDANITGLTTEFINACKNLHVPLEVWCPNDETAMSNLDSYVTGATSDLLNYKDVLINGNIGETDTGIVT